MIIADFPSERQADAPSPGRPSPHPVAHWFIVMFLRLGTGRSDQIRPPSCNLTMPEIPPAGHISEKMHSTKRNPFFVPRAIQPQPSQTEVDCGVVME
jgi:hypothetical protein